MNPLNGLTLAKARNLLSKGILPLIGGIYRDEFWLGPKKVWDYLGTNDIDFGIMLSEYKHNSEGVPCSKEWKVDFCFTDAKGKDQVIHGILIAHGAGSTKYPLDAYDLTMSIF